jgi:hypothetical protein
MKRTFLTGALLLCALIFTTTPAQAQACSGTSVSASCTWTASITVQAVLSCSVLQHFAFGSHPSSVGTVAGVETNTGRIRCQTNPGSALNVSFTLPTVLTNGPFSVPISFGTESARLYAADGSSGPVTAFNPATGFTGFQVSADGVAVLALGENGPNNEAAEVVVNIAGAAAGTYSGVIVATIVLQ